MPDMPAPRSIGRCLLDFCRSLPFLTLLALPLFCVYHNILRAWMKHTGLPIGALRWRSHVLPFYAKIHEDHWISWWTVPAVVVVALYFLLVRRLYIRGAFRPAVMLAISGAMFVSISVSVAMMDGILVKGGKPLPALLTPFNRTGYEYYGDVPNVASNGIHAFLRDYSKPEFFETLSLHARTHPPGGSVFQWLISKPFGYNLWSASILTILFTATAILPVFLLARLLYGETVARWSLAFFLLVPSFQLFTATCMDGVFSVFPMWSIYFFHRAMAADRKLPWAILTGLATAAAIFMTYATFFIGVYLAIALLLTLALDRRRFLNMLVVLVVAAASFAIFYVLFFLAIDFNLIEAMQASVKRARAMMGHGFKSTGQYLHLGLGNLLAFLFGAGVSLMVAWGMGCVEALRGCIRNRRACDIYVLAFPVSLVIIAFSGLFHLEVERIWLFMVPFLVIPAAKFVNGLCTNGSGMFPFYWVTGTLAVQLVAAEAIMRFPW